MTRAGLHCLLALVLTALLAGCDALARRAVLPQHGVRPADYAVKIDRNIAMKTRDGVTLVADVYRPQNALSNPTILVRIPFTKTFTNDLGAKVIGSFWASHGYNVVIQGARGRYKSGGAYYPLRSERNDGLDTLGWLDRQPWFDGRLGMWGGSAFGYAEWAIADQQDPGPSALMIQICSTSFHDMFYPGGAFSLESALYWGVRSQGKRDVMPSARALERGFQGLRAIDADRRAVGTIGFYEDWASHRELDAYWQAIDGQDRARTTKAPVLFMAGWSDPFLPSQLRDYASVRSDASPAVASGTRLIIGPWTHADAIRFPDGTTAGNYRPASLSESLPWFDHLLLGRPLDASLQSPVRIYVMGENVWRDEPAWPLARARMTSYYFDSQGKANSASGDGRLSLEPPAGPEPADSYIYDPRNPVPSAGGAMLDPRAGMQLQGPVEARPDVLVYTSAPLRRDLEVTGPVSAVLQVATSAAGTDFTVKLVDVDSQGHAYNVSDGILRRKYASAETSEITVNLWPTSMLFRTGHRIRVEVSSSDYPRYDRNLNTGDDPSSPKPVIAMQTVFHGPDLLSRIVLPVVPR